MSAALADGTINRDALRARRVRCGLADLPAEAPVWMAVDISVFLLFHAFSEKFVMAHT
jgi:hypothetical protein